MVFVGEGEGQGTGWPCLSGACINGVTAELSVQSEHIKDHHVRSHFFYSTVSKVAANIASTFWVALLRMLAPADGPQMYLSLMELGPHGMACLLISKQKRRGEKRRRQDEKEERWKGYTETLTYLHCLPRISNSPSAQVSVGFSFCLCVYLR